MTLEKPKLSILPLKHLKFFNFSARQALNTGQKGQYGSQSEKSKK